MGRLLHDIQYKMQHKVDNRETDPLKILVHSTHDTALAGICATLGVFDQKSVYSPLRMALPQTDELLVLLSRWPDFTASVTFELFRKPITPSASEAEVDSNINPLARSQDEAQSFLGSMYGTLSSPLRNGSITQKGPAHEYCTFRHYPSLPFWLWLSLSCNLTDVRMRYQNRNMIIPHCFPSGKHLPGRPEYCTLSAFQERVKELTPLDWEQECGSAGPSHAATK